MQKESKQEKFKRLAEKRGAKLLYQVKLLENLGSSAAYKVDEETAKKLLVTLEVRLQSLKRKWGQDETQPGETRIQ